MSTFLKIRLKICVGLLLYVYLIQYLNTHCPGPSSLASYKMVQQSQVLPG